MKMIIKENDQDIAPKLSQNNSRTSKIQEDWFWYLNGDKRKEFVELVLSNASLNKQKQNNDRKIESLKTQQRETENTLNDSKNSLVLDRNKLQGYYHPNLISWDENKWNFQSGDGYQFDKNSKFTQSDPEIQRISRELAYELLRDDDPYMNTGYAYDTGKPYNGIKVSHAGIDYRAGVGKEVFAVAPGKIIHISENNPGKFITVESEAGKRWLYGHVDSSISQEKLQKKDYFLNAGDLIGTVVYQSRDGEESTHFHVEVHTSPFDDNIIGGILYQTDGEFESVLRRTISPLQAYWEWRNQIVAKSTSLTT
jgi:murein DD-endopeptidase MepM/ murein hydrolase activator NlpD